MEYEDFNYYYIVVDIGYLYGVGVYDFLLEEVLYSNEFILELLIVYEEFDLM